MSEQDKEAALWLQEDARYLFTQYEKKRDEGGAVCEWLATGIQVAAAASSAWDRRLRGVEE